jgi:hypothetical protein
MVVLRVFDVDPGPGPVTPIRMTSTSSVERKIQRLYGRSGSTKQEQYLQ